MLTLREKMEAPSAFLCGVELVTTRGTMSDDRAVQTRELARELAEQERLDWISITDNAGGNPMLGPMALGKPVLYAGKEVLIHLSCKDFNRNALESEAWHLASEGFHNILALSGDYPTQGYQGAPKPVFDLDSVGLLSMLREMNRGFALPARKKGKRLDPTRFFLGAVTTNFKLHENEVVPQYLKLEKKLEVGAEFIIAQIGFDARKSGELKTYLDVRGSGSVPLIGNVFLLSPRVARFFNSGKMPGVVVSDALLEECLRHGRSADGGKAFFLEFAARQAAIFRGLGYRGVYLGGIERAEDLEAILDRERSFGPEDWKTFARQIRYSRPGEFFLFGEDAAGLADPRQVNSGPVKGAPLSYRLSKWVHDLAFTPGRALHSSARVLYERSADPAQGPGLLRAAEHLSKALLFKCKDCGDCSLPDTAFLCPESQCVKNQRNGPCGGTREGKCEVDERECIWARAYDRLKSEGREKDLLAHAPVIQNQALRGTSSWANAILGRDHRAVPEPEMPPPVPKPPLPAAEKPV